MRRDEIVKALRCFASEENCPVYECNEKCPYWMESDKFDRGNPKAEISDEHQLCHAAADMLEQDAKKTNWISVKDRLPESGEKVIARLQSTTFQSHWATTILAHIKEHEKTTDDSDWRDCECDTEYDEKNDCYWIPECWYEVNVVDDNPNWIIGSDYNVTHWMPLPDIEGIEDET